MAAIKRLLRCAVLCSFIACSITLQSFRDEGEIIHNVKLPSKRFLRRRNAAKSLRMHFVYVDVNNSNEKVLKELLQKAETYFKNTLKVKYQVDKIVLQRRCANDSYFLKNETGDGPGSVRFCKKSCDTVRHSCGIARVEDKDLGLCHVCDENGHNCKIEKAQSSNFGVGYKNTDFVLYVTTLMNKCDKPKTVAYAAACQQEMTTDRPVAGFINVCPNKLSNKSPDDLELLSTIKHEIYHALGFSPSLFAFYRNSTGSPLTKRLENGLPAYDSQLKVYKWNDKIIKKITRSNWKIMESKGEVKHDVNLIVTPRVREEAQKHFNCSSLEGAELENQGGPGTELAHWEKRLFENEGMTGAFTQNSAFSRITLALMEDTGWYEANYDMAEPLIWGKNLGCVFAKNSCKAWMMAQSNKTIYPFCDRLKKKDEGLHTGCSVDKSSVAMCNLVEYNAPLPLEYQYFNNISGISNPESYGGSVEYADYCPYYQALTWTKDNIELRGSSCILQKNQKPQDKNYALEKYGNAKCFIQDRKWQKSKCRTRWITSNWGSGCYRYKCTSHGLIVLVNGHEFNCSFAGQVLNLDIQTSDGWDHNGSIVCPRCHDICYNSHVTCPKDVYPAPGVLIMPKKQPVVCQGNILHCLGLHVLAVILYTNFIVLS